jgi:hypothetical protein
MTFLTNTPFQNIPHQLLAERLLVRAQTSPSGAWCSSETLSGTMGNYRRVKWGQYRIYLLKTFIHFGQRN